MISSRSRENSPGVRLTRFSSSNFSRKFFSSEPRSWMSGRWMYLRLRSFSMNAVSMCSSLTTEVCPGEPSISEYREEDIIAPSCITPVPRQPRIENPGEIDFMETRGRAVSLNRRAHFGTIFLVRPWGRNLIRYPRSPSRPILFKNSLKTVK